MLGAYTVMRMQLPLDHRAVDAGKIYFRIIRKTT